MGSKQSVNPQFPGSGAPTPPGGGAAQPLAQIIPQFQQSKAAQPGSYMNNVLQQIFNGMFGIQPGQQGGQPGQQSPSPRDAIIQLLMGGNYGR